MHLAPRTVAGYRRTIEALDAFLLAGDVDLPQIDARILRRFLALRREAPSTIAGRITAIRAVCRSLRIRGAVLADPAGGLIPPRIPRGSPRVLSVDTVQALVSAAETPRDRALLELLYGAGLHGRELVRLDVDHVDLALERDGLGTVRVSDRRLPVGREAVRALRAYLGKRASGPLFIAGDTRLGLGELRAAVRRAGLAAGVADVTPRALRDAFAVHLLDGGADLSVVQVLLGHRSARATMRYLGAAIDHLVKVYDAAHPLARHRRAPPRAA